MSTDARATLTQIYPSTDLTVTVEDDRHVVLTETFPYPPDDRLHLFGSLPDVPFVAADRVLAEHGWRRHGAWMVGHTMTADVEQIAR